MEGLLIEYHCPFTCIVLDKSQHVKVKTKGVEQFVVIKAVTCWRKSFVFSKIEYSILSITRTSPCWEVLITYLNINPQRNSRQSKISFHIPSLGLAGASLFCVRYKYTDRKTSPYIRLEPDAHIALNGNEKFDLPGRDFVW